jgi:hypothetical protein
MSRPSAEGSKSRTQQQTEAAGDGGAGWSEKKKQLLRQPAGASAEGRESVP